MQQHYVKDVVQRHVLQLHANLLERIHEIQQINRDDDKRSMLATYFKDAQPVLVRLLALVRYLTISTPVIESLNRAKQAFIQHTELSAALTATLKEVLSWNIQFNEPKWDVKLSLQTFYSGGTNMLPSITRHLPGFKQTIISNLQRPIILSSIHHHIKLTLATFPKQPALTPYRFQMYNGLLYISLPTSFCLLLRPMMLPPKNFFSEKSHLRTDRARITWCIEDLYFSLTITQASPTVSNNIRSFAQYGDDLAAVAARTAEHSSMGAKPMLFHKNSGARRDMHGNLITGPVYKFIWKSNQLLTRRREIVGTVCTVNPIETANRVVVVIAMVQKFINCFILDILNILSRNLLLQNNQKYSTNKQKHLQSQPSPQNRRASLGEKDGTTSTSLFADVVEYQQHHTLQLQYLADDFRLATLPHNDGNRNNPHNHAATPRLDITMTAMNVTLYTSVNTHDTISELPLPTNLRLSHPHTSINTTTLLNVPLYYLSLSHHPNIPALHQTFIHPNQLNLPTIIPTLKQYQSEVKLNSFLHKLSYQAHQFDDVDDVLPHSDMILVDKNQPNLHHTNFNIISPNQNNNPHNNTSFYMFSSALFRYNGLNRQKTNANTFLETSKISTTPLTYFSHKHLTPFSPTLHLASSTLSLSATINGVSAFDQDLYELWQRQQSLHPHHPSQFAPQIKFIHPAQSHPSLPPFSYYHYPTSSQTYNWNANYPLSHHSTSFNSLLSHVLPIFHPTVSTIIPYDPILEAGGLTYLTLSLPNYLQQMFSLKKVLTALGHLPYYCPILQYATTTLTTQSLPAPSKLPNELVDFAQAFPSLLFTHADYFERFNTTASTIFDTCTTFTPLVPSPPSIITPTLAISTTLHQQLYTEMCTTQHHIEHPHHNVITDDIFNFPYFVFLTIPSHFYTHYIEKSLKGLPIDHKDSSSTSNLTYTLPPVVIGVCHIASFFKHSGADIGELLPTYTQLMNTIGNIFDNNTAGNVQRIITAATRIAHSLSATILVNDILASNLFHLNTSLYHVPSSQQCQYQRSQTSTHITSSQSHYPHTVTTITKAIQLHSTPLHYFTLSSPQQIAPQYIIPSLSTFHSTTTLSPTSSQHFQCNNIIKINNIYPILPLLQLYTPCVDSFDNINTDDEYIFSWTIPALSVLPSTKQTKLNAKIPQYHLEEDILANTMIKALYNVDTDELTLSYLHTSHTSTPSFLPLYRYFTRLVLLSNVIQQLYTLNVYLVLHHKSFMQRKDFHTLHPGMVLPYTVSIDHTILLKVTPNPHTRLNIFAQRATAPSTPQNQRLSTIFNPHVVLRVIHHPLAVSALYGTDYMSLIYPQTPSQAADYPTYYNDASILWDNILAPLMNTYHYQQEQSSIDVVNNFVLDDLFSAFSQIISHHQPQDIYVPFNVCNVQYNTYHSNHIIYPLQAIYLYTQTTIFPANDSMFSTPSTGSSTGTTYCINQPLLRSLIATVSDTFPTSQFFTECVFTVLSRKNFLPSLTDHLPYILLQQPIPTHSQHVQSSSLTSSSTKWNESHLNIINSASNMNKLSFIYLISVYLVAKLSALPPVTSQITVFHKIQLYLKQTSTVQDLLRSPVPTTQHRPSWYHHTIKAANYNENQLTLTYPTHSLRDVKALCLDLSTHACNVTATPRVMTPLSNQYLLSMPISALTDLLIATLPPSPAKYIAIDPGSSTPPPGISKLLLHNISHYSHFFTTRVTSQEFAYSVGLAFSLALRTIAVQNGNVLYTVESFDLTAKDYKSNFFQTFGDTSARYQPLVQSVKQAQTHPSVNQINHILSPFMTPPTRLPQSPYPRVVPQHQLMYHPGYLVNHVIAMLLKIRSKSYG